MELRVGRWRIARDRDAGRGVWFWLCRFAYRRARLASSRLPSGRIPDGIPSIRDPEHPCSAYRPRKPEARDFECRGDGHYLCLECAHRAVWVARNPDEVEAEVEVAA